MAKELQYIDIDGSPGGNQDWFTDPMMKLGGCAAVCACDSAIYFARSFGLGALCPFEAAKPSKEDFIQLSRLMKPYLRPRWEGVNKPQIYIDGFGQFMADRGVGSVTMSALSGESAYEQAEAAVIRQIYALLPVPCLVLDHSDKAFSDYEWHWFMLIGYDKGDGDFRVLAVTYGKTQWLSLKGLWNTGCTPKGGLVLYKI